MRGKVYFKNGAVESILNYIIHTDYDVEFWTKDAHYHYMSLIEDHSFLYEPLSIIQVMKHRHHYFYKITDTAILVDIDRIEIFFGKEHNHG